MNRIALTIIREVRETLTLVENGNQQYEKVRWIRYKMEG